MTFSKAFAAAAFATSLAMMPVQGFADEAADTTPETQEAAPSNAVPPGGLDILDTLKSHMDGVQSSVGALIAKIEVLKLEKQQGEEAFATLDEQLSRTEARLAERDAKVAELEKNASGASDRLGMLQENLFAAKAQLQALQADVAEASDKTAALEALSEEKIALEKEIAEAKEAAFHADVAITRITGERDALDLQRFWLAVTVAFLLVLSIYLARRRGRAPEA